MKQIKSFYFWLELFALIVIIINIKRDILFALKFSLRVVNHLLKIDKWLISFFSFSSFIIYCVFGTSIKTYLSIVKKTFSKKKNKTISLKNEMRWCMFLHRQVMKICERIFRINIIQSVRILFSIWKKSTFDIIIIISWNIILIKCCISKLWLHHVKKIFMQFWNISWKHQLMIS